MGREKIGSPPQTVVRHGLFAAAVIVVTAVLILVRVRTSADGALGSIMTVFFSGYHLTVWSRNWAPGIAAFTLLHYLLAYLVIPVVFTSKEETDDFMVTFLLVVLAGTLVAYVQIWVGRGLEFTTDDWRRRTLTTRNRQFWWSANTALATSFLVLPIIGTFDYLPLGLGLRLVISLVLMPVLYRILGWRLESFFGRQHTDRISVTGLFPVFLVHWTAIAVFGAAELLELTEGLRAEAVGIGIYSAVAIVGLVGSRVCRGRRPSRR
jgi:hypothetical protein